MKRLALVVLLLAAPATAQPIPPDDASATDVIANKCADEWPTDFAMRLYCVRKQQDAIRQLANPQYIPQPIIETGATDKNTRWEPVQFYDGYHRPLNRYGEPIR